MSFYFGQKGRRSTEGRDKKLIALADWYAEVGRLDCEACKKKWSPGPWDTPELKKAKLNAPRCKTCKPQVEPGNIIAVELFRRVYTSEGIRMESLEAAMRIFNIRKSDRAEIADKVLIMADQTAKQIRATRGVEPDA